MKKLLFIFLMIISPMIGFGQVKQAKIEASKILQADKTFIWQNDTIKKDSISYAEIKTDSIRFKYISGSFSKWYWDWGIVALTSGKIPCKSASGYLINSPLSTDGTDITADHNIIITNDLSVGNDISSVRDITSGRNVIVTKDIGSPTYFSGLLGSGWLMDGDSARLTLDYLTVRKSLKAYELLISKIRSVNGGLVISAANATIDSVYQSGSNFQVFPEDTTITFISGDIARCQVVSGIGTKYYSALVDSISSDSPGSFWCHIIDGTDVPAVGDEMVQFGNTTDACRQGLVYLTATEDNSPYIDVLDSISSADFKDKTKIRLGDLTGITTKTWGALTGWGLYGQNVYLENGYFSGKIYVTGGNAATTSEVSSSADSTLTKAKDYASAKADTAQSNAVSTAAGDAATKANAALSSAQGYASAVGDTVRGYSDDNLSTAKTYAASQASSALGSAKSYADAIESALDGAKQDAIVNGETLIEGGYLNTDFIEAGSITADMIKTSALYVSSSNVTGLSDSLDDLESSVKDYADGVASTAESSAVSTASSDATTKANSALSSAKSYAATQDASNLSTAKTYAASQASSSLSTAKTYASSVGDTIRDYSDTNLGTAKSYAATQDASNLSTAKTYAASQASSSLTSAKSYSDTNLSTAKSYAATQDATNLSTAKTYAASQASSALTSAKSYAATQDATNLSTAESYAASQASSALSSAKSYADNIESSLDADKQDAVVNGSTLIENGYLNTDFIEAGTITASMIASKTITAANIAAGTITADKLVATDITSLGNLATVGTITAGAFNLGSGKFKVTSAGVLTATSATITGTINATAGAIGNFTIDSYGLINKTATGSLYLANASSSPTRYVLLQPATLRDPGSFGNDVCTGLFVNTGSTSSGYINYGVYAAASNALGSSYAGYFEGNLAVTGAATFTGDITLKSGKIHTTSSDVSTPANSSSYVTLSSSYHVFILSAKTANRNYYLPDPAAYNYGEKITVINYNDNDGYLYPQSGDYINGSTGSVYIKMTDSQHSVELMSDGLTRWYIAGGQMNDFVE